MPKYECTVYGGGDNYTDNYWARDNKDAIAYGRRLAYPRDGKTLVVKRIAYSGHRDTIFEYSYKKRKDYRKSNKK